MKMADVCDDDGVSGESLRKKGAERLLSFFMPKLLCGIRHKFIECLEIGTMVAAYKEQVKCHEDGRCV